MAQTERNDHYYPGSFPQFFPWSGPEVQERIRQLQLGPLAEMLAPFRQEERPRPRLFVIATYRCKHCCPFCYVEAGENAKGSDINPEMIAKVFEATVGMPAVISGGEPTLHHQFEEILESATERMSWVSIFTNGAFFLPKERGSLSETELAEKIRERMKNFLQGLPPHVELSLPVTPYHLAYPHHAELIQAGIEFANAWRFDSTRPLVDFTVKPNVVPNAEDSNWGLQQGVSLINHFGLYGLGRPGAWFPGNVIHRGRARNLPGAIKPQDDLSFDGELHVDHTGIYSNESSLLRARGVSGATVRPELEGPIATSQEIKDGLLVEKFSHWLRSLP